MTRREEENAAELERDEDQPPLVFVYVLWSSSRHWRWFGHGFLGGLSRVLQK